MSSLYFIGDQILFSGGLLGFHKDCCCALGRCEGTLCSGSGGAVPLVLNLKIEGVIAQGAGVCECATFWNKTHSVNNYGIAHVCTWYKEFSIDCPPFPPVFGARITISKFVGGLQITVLDPGGYGEIWHIDPISSDCLSWSNLSASFVSSFSFGQACDYSGMAIILNP